MVFDLLLSLYCCYFIIAIYIDYLCHCHLSTFLSNNSQNSNIHVKLFSFVMCFSNVSSSYWSSKRIFLTPLPNSCLIRRVVLFKVLKEFLHCVSFSSSFCRCIVLNTSLPWSTIKDRNKMYFSSSVFPQQQNRTSCSTFTFSGFLSFLSLLEIQG